VVRAVAPAWRVDRVGGVRASGVGEVYLVGGVMPQVTATPVSSGNGQAGLAGNVVPPRPPTWRRARRGRRHANHEELAAPSPVAGSEQLPRRDCNGDVAWSPLAMAGFGDRPIAHDRHGRRPATTATSSARRSCPGSRWLGNRRSVIAFWSHSFGLSAISKHLAESLICRRVGRRGRQGSNLRP
jgi:hypothetical protein